MRTGDTPSNDRQKLIRRPPDLLITTPESLYLMLTSTARETLRGVETVIVDEIHAMATTKRGAHLALSLERLEEVTDRPPQRIGLSATQRPLEEIARFLGGYADADTPAPRADRRRRRPQAARDRGRRARRGHGRTAAIDRRRSASRASRRATLAASGRASTRAILELVLAHRSTIIFCNARRAAERLAAKLNELAEQAGHRCRPRHRADDRRPRQGPPRVARPRAAGRDRGPAQARRAAGDRRHVVARTRASTWAPSTS